MEGGGDELKLLGTWSSPFVTRAKLALHLKGVSYEYVEEDLRNKSELLLSSNPVHKTVPVLIHNGKLVCESQIIVQYIDEAFGGVGPSLLPADPYERAVARFWAAYIEDKLVAPWDQVFRANTDEERAEWMKKTLAAVDALEGGLKECSKGKAFFGGDSIGYVDVVLGGAVAALHCTRTRRSSVTSSSTPPRPHSWRRGWSASVSSPSPRRSYRTSTGLLSTSSCCRHGGKQLIKPARRHGSGRSGENYLLRIRHYTMPLVVSCVS